MTKSAIVFGPLRATVHLSNHLSEDNIKNRYSSSRALRAVVSPPDAMLQSVA